MGSGQPLPLDSLAVAFDSSPDDIIAAVKWLTSRNTPAAVKVTNDIIARSLSNADPDILLHALDLSLDLAWSVNSGTMDERKDGRKEDGMKDEKKSQKTKSKSKHKSSISSSSSTTSISATSTATPTNATTTKTTATLPPWERLLSEAPEGAVLRASQRLVARTRAQELAQTSLHRCLEREAFALLSHRRQRCLFPVNPTVDSRSTEEQQTDEPHVLDPLDQLLDLEASSQRHRVRIPSQSFHFVTIYRWGLYCALSGSESSKAVRFCFLRAGDYHSQ